MAVAMAAWPASQLDSCLGPYSGPAGCLDGLLTILQQAGQMASLTQPASRQARAKLAMPEHA